MLTRVVVGAPVRGREWIAADWARHADKACREAGVAPTFVVVADASDPTVDLLAANVEDLRVVAVDEAELSDVRRPGRWTPGRKQRMVELRNLLLGEVRRLAPNLFWSLDTDILAHPGALAAMVEPLDRFDAVGGACFMSPLTVRPDGTAVGSTRYPSYLRLNGGTGLGTRTWEPGKVITVDVIMASKLMNPAAYAIDYQFAHSGEDIGWSQAAKAAGLRLGWTSTVVSKHVMYPHLLDIEDPRCGY